MPTQPPLHPTLGFYGPESQMWRINREAIVLGAGVAALLLQLAHPHVAEGVAQHSRFQNDPFGRLRGTLRTTLDLVFGDARRAQRAVDRLNRIHRRVQGDAVDPVARDVVGDRYHALDPALLLWVQATLIVSSVVVYERWVGPVTPAERDQLWQEAREVGFALGIPLHLSPEGWAGLQAYWDEMLRPDGPVQVTPTARRLAADIVRPPFPYVPDALREVVSLPSIAMLPTRVREGYGLPFGPGRRIVTALMDGAIRVWVRATPGAWRSFPPARAADRRAARLRASRTSAP